MCIAALVSSVSFVAACLVLAVPATHGVKETAGDVKAVPEVTVVEIAGLNDEIRADIFFLPQEHGFTCRGAVGRSVSSPDHEEYVQERKQSSLFADWIRPLG